MRQLPLPVQLRSSSVFASFYAGANREVVEQLRDLRSGPRSTSVWLYGSPGAGKTHLLQAVCAQFGERNFTAAYFPLSDQAVSPDALTGCESLDLVCLDDLERVAGVESWERAIFRLYTEMSDTESRLLVAAASAPINTGISLKDLASRLAAGNVLRIQTLADDEQIAALMLRAERLGMVLTTEGAHFLVNRLPRDMSTLCAMLDKLDRVSLAAQRRLTIPFLRSVIDAPN